MMLEKEKLLHHDQIPSMKTFHGDRVENMYAYNMYQQFQENETLQHHKFRTQDSEQIDTIKASLQTITNIMQETIPQTKEELSEKISTISSTYTNLISSCNTYLEQHPRPITRAAKIAKRLIKGTLFLAQKESGQLYDAMRQLLMQAKESGEKDLLWGNLLGIIRGVTINLDDHFSVTHGGANSSDLLILKSKEKRTYFYKADEKLTTPVEALTEEYKNLKKPKEKHIFDQLMRLMDYQAERKMDKRSNEIHFESKWAKIDDLFELDADALEPTILTALKKKRTRSVRRDIKNLVQTLKKTDMPDLNLNLDDAQTWKMVKEILPKYYLLRNQMGVSLSCGIDLGESLSQRNIASSRMASILGMPSLVVPTNKATLQKDGETMQKGQGIIMSEAKGASYYDVLKKANGLKNIIFTPEAMRQISCLQLFDTVCAQCDRHQNNRFVTYREENGIYTITGIQGIDNDMSFGDLEFKHVATNSMYMQLPAFLTKEGDCSIPFLDAAMVDSLRALTKEHLQYYLGDLLKPKYMDALWNRITNILKAIDLSAKDNACLLLEKEQWSDKYVSTHFTTLNNAYV